MSAPELMRAERAMEFLGEMKRLTVVAESVDGEAAETWLTSAPPTKGESGPLMGSELHNALHHYNRYTNPCIVSTSYVPPGVHKKSRTGCQGTMLSDCGYCNPQTPDNSSHILLYKMIADMVNSLLVLLWMVGLGGGARTQSQEHRDSIKPRGLAAVSSFKAIPFFFRLTS